MEMSGKTLVAMTAVELMAAMKREMTWVGTTMVVHLMLAQLFTAMVLRVPAATEFTMEGASQQAAQEPSP